MKSTFSTNVNNNAVNLWLLISRVAIGLLMLRHGIPKLQMLMSGNIQFGNPIGIGITASLILCVFAEFICSVLLILGLATRLAAVSLIINMLVAVFIALSTQPFDKKELGILYLLFYLGILILGAGRYSIDHFIGGGKSKRR